MAERPLLVVAVPKGRVLAQLAPRLAAIGVAEETLRADDRRLVRDDPRSQLRFLLLKPDDVPTYVEYGAADVGVVGRDVLLEHEHELYTPVDLGIGRCRMVVAGVPGAASRASRTLRIGTKFPSITARHFRAAGQPVEIVYVQGSVELAPVTGLADLIVDLVESGETLRQNGLVELETILEVSAVVVVNRAALKLRSEPVGALLDALRA
jgi:ATP phosphoribosyltransferase